MAPRRIVILRHAEKPDDTTDRHLSPAGQRRAKLLATIIPQRFPNPDFLFAAADSKNSDRPVETLTPLATVLGMKLDDSIADDDYQVLSANLTKQKIYDGKLIVVCWHHGHIPDLAMSLGASQADIDKAPEMIATKWNPTVFDRFWILDMENGATHFATVSQATGDQAQPI